MIEHRRCELAMVRVKSLALRPIILLKEPHYLNFLKQNWFLVSMGLALGLGYTVSAPLAWLAEVSWLRAIMVFTVLFAMALPIPFRDVRSRLANPQPAVLAVVINLLLAPLLAWLLSQLLPGSLGGGLLVASVVPSTMASAAVWTKRAGGDESIPIMVTLATSLLAVVFAPLWLWLLLGKSVQLDVARMTLDLSLTVVLPICLAQVFTTHRKIASLASQYQASLSLYCQLAILLMVSIGAIQLGQTPADQAMSQQGMPLFILVPLMIFLTLSVHVIALTIGFFGAKKLGMSHAEQIAVSLSGSQKTLMIGLKLAVDCGVSVLPMIVFHVGQLLLDAILVDRWRKKKGTPPSMPSGPTD